MSESKIDTAKLDTIIKNIPSRIDGFLSTISDEIVEDIQNSFGDDSPSEPGDPPAIVTGALHDSVVSAKASDTEYQVLVGKDYGLYLEFGTEKMLPRPFMIPMFHSWEKKFVDRVRDLDLTK